MTVEDAQKKLSKAGISSTTTLREVDEAQAGKVLEVDPPGGTVLGQGQSVTLVVGKATVPAALAVPSDLIGKTADAAKTQLDAAEIPFNTTLREVDEAQVGKVLEVDPPGGTVLGQGQSVTLVVGKATVPAALAVPSDLIGKTADAAKTQLDAAKIPFTTSFKEVDEAQVGKVLEVDPAGGTVLGQGQSVRLLIGRAKGSPPPLPVQPGALSITAVQLTKIGAGNTCDLVVTAANNLTLPAEDITLVGQLQMNDQGDTLLALNFSERSGLETLHAQKEHRFHGKVVFLPGVTASYTIQLVQGTTVIDESSGQGAKCA